METIISKSYGGSQTRLILPQVKDVAGVTGDNYSTKLCFKLPRQYASGWIKYIEFDCLVERDGIGDVYPIYLLDANDSFRIPYEIASLGGEIRYNLKFVSTDGTVTEKSEQGTLYFRTSVSGTNVSPETEVDIVTYLASHAYCSVSYSDGGSDTNNPPVLTFSPFASGGETDTVELNVPYLDGNGHILSRFLDKSVVVEVYHIDSPEKLTTLENAQVPDMAIIDRGQSSEYPYYMDLYVLINPGYNNVDNWYLLHTDNPIYSSLNVDGDASITGAVSITGNPSIEGDVSITGDSSIDGDLSITGDVSLTDSDLKNALLSTDDDGKVVKNTTIPASIASLSESKQDNMTASAGIKIVGVDIQHDTAISGGTIGDTNQIPVITFDNYGHITSTTTKRVYAPTSMGGGGQYVESTGVLGNPPVWVTKVSDISSIDANSNSKNNAPSAIAVKTYVDAGTSSLQDSKVNKSDVTVPSTVPVLSWDTESTIGSVDGKAFKVKMPLNPDTDAKTTSAEKADTKLYLVGAESQSSSGQTTYSNQKVYVGTDNNLYSNGSEVVNLADPQTIPGKKTFSATNGFIIQNDGGAGHYAITLNDTVLEKDTTPATDNYPFYIRILDKNGVKIADPMGVKFSGGSDTGQIDFIAPKINGSVSNVDFSVHSGYTTSSYRSYASASNYDILTKGHVADMMNANVFNSQISLTSSRGTAIDSFTLNQSSGKSIVLPAGSTQYENQSVTFALQSTPDFSDYPYRGTVNITNMTASTYATVTYSDAQVQSGQYAPFCQSASGCVYLYAKSNVGTQTIPTISAGVDDSSTQANMSNFVTLTGGQIISGSKTITGALTSSGGVTFSGIQTFTRNYPIYFKSGTINGTSYPTGTLFDTHMVAQDSAGNAIMNFYNSQTSTGQGIVRFDILDPIGNKSNYLAINSAGYAQTSTPGVSAPTTAIPTIAWISDTGGTLNNLLHTSGNETKSGELTLTSAAKGNIFNSMGIPYKTASQWYEVCNFSAPSYIELDYIVAQKDFGVNGLYVSKVNIQIGISSTYPARSMIGYDRRTVGVYSSLDLSNNLILAKDSNGVYHVFLNHGGFRYARVYLKYAQNLSNIQTASVTFTMTEVTEPQAADYDLFINGSLIT